MEQKKMDRNCKQWTMPKSYLKTQKYKDVVYLLGKKIVDKEVQIGSEQVGRRDDVKKSVLCQAS